jgi:transcriptional regulator with XRE-family HTH domain
MPRRRTVVDPQFSVRLRQLRTVRGLSQQALARAAFLSKSYLSELENGRKTPGVTTAKALDKALGAGGELAGMVTDAPLASPDGGEASLAIRGLQYHPSESDTVEIVLQIGRADVKRRAIISAPFVLTALAAPSRDWLLASLEAITSQRGPRQVGMGQVAGIRDVFALFQEMDVMRGGGHARVALVEYLNSYVLPLVQRDHGSQTVRLALYEAASEQAYLVGWMAYDDGRHGLGQRYLIQALRLAQASGSRALGAHVLAGMSDQANLLGNPREALMLARTGARGITTDESPACIADLLLLQGRALAAQGEVAAAARAVAAAERTFDQVRPDDEPEWARFIDPAYVYGEAAHCFRDLNEPGEIERFATQSAEAAARQGRARRGALSYAALAVGEIERGNPDAAAAHAHHVVDLTAQITSSRCVATVRDLATRLKPYHHLDEVQAFHAHATDRLGITT